MARDIEALMQEAAFDEGYQLGLAASDKKVRDLEKALRDLVHWLEDGNEDDMTAVHAARLALSHTKEGEG